MPVKYILDTREKGLQALFTKNGMSYETRQLDLGDILILYSKGEIIQNVEQDSNESKLLKEEIKIQEHPIYTFTIERKSYKDLKASLSDTRYREQKSRYIQLPKGTVYYIFENNDPQFRELGKKQFVGSYIHTMLRDRLGVLLTSSMEETYEYIIKMGETLEKFGWEDTNQTSSQEQAVDSTQIKKKRAKGSEVYRQQLCCIPGISAGKADLIIKEYKDMTSLMEVVKNNTFKIKGIGKVLLENIKESLFFDI